MSSPEPLCGALAGFILVRFLIFWIIANRFPNHRTAWTPRPEYSEIEHIIENQLQVVLVRFPKNNGDYEYRFCEIFREERKIPNSIPIVNDEDIYVEFSRVDFYPQEGKIEVWLWVKNQLNEMIYVSAKNVVVNGKAVCCDYPLDELEERKDDYLKMTLDSEDLREICAYSELKQVEFKIMVDDAEVKPLLWSNKIEILLDMTDETYTVNIV